MMSRYIYALALFLCPFAAPQCIWAQAQDDSLTNNPPFNRGFYIFENNKIFDFKKGNVSLDENERISHPLADCSNYDYYCFKSTETSIIIPRSCPQYFKSNHFALGNIKSEIIYDNKQRPFYGHAYPFRRMSRNFVFYNPDFSHVAYVVSIYVLGPLGITQIIYDREKKLDLKKLFSDPDFVAMDLRERQAKYPSYGEYDLLGADPFAKCEPDPKT